MTFSFEINQNIGNFIYNNKSFAIWDLSYKSFNEDLFNLYDFELFMSRIKNDKDCVFYKDKKIFFQYINKHFIIEPYNLKISIPINENNMNELITVLQKIYDWIQSISIQSILQKENL